MTTATTTSIELRDIDPTTVHVPDDLQRTDLGDITGLAASIAEVGLLQPIVVNPNGDGYALAIGRRRLAAVLSNNSPTIRALVADATAAETRALAELIENEQRKDLTSAEVVRAYEQLALLGVDDATIGRLTGVPGADVTEVRAVNAAPRALALVERHDMTMDEALGLAEFDGDDDALKVLVAASKTGQWDHVLQRLRQDRIDAARHQAMVDDLKAKGYTVVDDVPLGSSGARRINSLVSPAGVELKPYQHRKCPGAVVWVSDQLSGPHAVHYCTDPVANGHKGADGFTAPTAKPSADATSKADQERADKESAERRRVLANNKAWRAATDVRRRFVADMAKRKTPPKGLLAWAVTEVLTGSHVLTEPDGALFQTWTGKRPKRQHDVADIAAQVLTTAKSDPTLVMALATYVLACIESDRVMHVNVWRSPESQGRQRRYLTFLASAGYTLSDVEKIVANAKAK